MLRCHGHGDGAVCWRPPRANKPEAEFTDFQKNLGFSCTIIEGNGTSEVKVKMNSSGSRRHFPSLLILTLVTLLSECRPTPELRSITNESLSHLLKVFWAGNGTRNRSLDLDLPVSRVKRFTRLRMPEPVLILNGQKYYAPFEFQFDPDLDLVDAGIELYRFRPALYQKPYSDG
jgi:hypothetical protein